MKKAILEENASETAPLGRMKRTELAESMGVCESPVLLL